MRVGLLGLLLLAGCVGFHPLDKRRGESVADAAEASAPTLDHHGEVSPWQEIGRSVEGRPLRIRRVGHGPRRVIWVGGIHGNEREGVVATEQLPDVFLHEPGAVESVTLTILEDVNPDGSFHNTRTNKNGVDLNRNYPANNYVPGQGRGSRALDQPEAYALHELIRAERPHLVIVAHSWHDRHFINFDGPCRHLAERFSRRSGYPVEASDNIAPTPGSLGSWVGRTLGVPILTLEYHRGHDPVSCWLDTREAILSVILSG
ncbi:MAG: DUF2817 domain-containing protein [Planctomycetota bacterium]